MQTPIKLIVGLGNPGPEHAQTRHNAGAWFVSELANQHNLNLNRTTKFHGFFGSIEIEGDELKVLLPTTYMNLSGQAVQSVVSYYKIPVESVLIAHDELDFPPGVARLKYEGGSGGHKGLQSVIQHLGDNFHRLRIGIGHPGHKDLVHNYVLMSPPLNEKKLIMQSIEKAISIVPELINGYFEKAQNFLHSEE